MVESLTISENMDTLPGVVLSDRVLPAGGVVTLRYVSGQIYVFSYSSCSVLSVSNIYK